MWNLTLNMIGASDSPSLHAKAAESKGLLLFTEHLFERHLNAFTQKLDPSLARRGKLIREAAVSAVCLENAFATEARVVTRAQAQAALDAYIRFVRFYVDAGGPLVPKHHWMLHLLQRVVPKGNPKKYSTYRDESFNGMLARIARLCHRRTWMNIVHWKCQCLHDTAHKQVCASELFS